MQITIPPRRKFLGQIVSLVPASVLVSVGVSQTGCQRIKDEKAATENDSPEHKYSPTFFTQAEWDFISAAVDLLIPADEHGAGALQARVPDFIDRQMETAYGHGKLWYMEAPFHTEVAPELGYQLNLVPRDIYRRGVRACNTWCSGQYGQEFPSLDAPSRIHVLEQLEEGKLKLDDVPGKLLFDTLLQNTKEGYWSDPMHGGNHHMVGWKMIGFPGARADFTDWISQPGVKYPLGPVSIRGEQS